MVFLKARGVEQAELLRTRPLRICRFGHRSLGGTGIEVDGRHIQPEIRPDPLQVESQIPLLLPGMGEVVQ